MIIRHRMKDICATALVAIMWVVMPFIISFAFLLESEKTPLERAIIRLELAAGIIEDEARDIHQLLRELRPAQ